MRAGVNVTKKLGSDGPAPEALLAALEHNFAEAEGVRRLDQQFVYVPLAALAAAVYGVAGQNLAFAHVPDGSVVSLLWITCGLVAFGLVRNHMRHIEILGRRRDLLEQLHLPPLRLDRWFHLGRVVYFGLFALGRYAGGYALVGLLPPS